MKPYETVDNADNPTFWSHCPACSVIDWGIEPVYQAIADDMVRLNKQSVTMQQSGYDLEGLELEYWYQVEIRAMSGIVRTVIENYKRRQEFSKFSK